MQNNKLKLEMLRITEKEKEENCLRLLIRDDVKYAFKYYFEDSVVAEKHAEKVSSLTTANELIDWCNEQEENFSSDTKMMDVLIMYRNNLDMVLEEVKRYAKESI